MNLCKNHQIFMFCLTFLFLFVCLQEPSAVRLKLRKPKSDKKVKWDADTVDNEHMNKRKSKCQ